MFFGQLSAWVLVLASVALAAMDGPHLDVAAPRPLTQAHAWLEEQDPGAFEDEGGPPDPSGPMAEAQAAIIPSLALPGGGNLPAHPADPEEGEDKENIPPPDPLRLRLRDYLARHPQSGLGLACSLVNAVDQRRTFTLHDCFENRLGEILVFGLRGQFWLSLEGVRSFRLEPGEAVLLAAQASGATPMRACLFSVTPGMGRYGLLEDLGIRFVPPWGEEATLFKPWRLVPPAEVRVLGGEEGRAWPATPASGAPRGRRRWPETRAAILDGAGS